MCVGSVICHYANEYPQKKESDLKEKSKLLKTSAYDI